MWNRFISVAFSREAIIAFCLGVFFPVFTFLFRASDVGYPLNVDSVARIHEDHRLTWMADFAPLVLWLMGCLIANYRQTTLEQIEAADADKKETQLILDSAADGIFIVDRRGIIVSGNKAAHEMLGYPIDELIGTDIQLIRPKRYIENLEEQIALVMPGGAEAYKVYEQEGRRKDGSCFPVEYSVSLVGEGIATKIVLIVRDTTARIALEEQLNQAQKLESIGQLSAGIAHEINTPIQYVNDNMRTISEYLADIRTMTEGYQRLMLALEEQNLLSEQVKALRNLESQVDLEFILEDAPNAMEQSLQGIQRVSEIVKAMKIFSHAGGGQVSMLDINASLKSTLVVARNEYKYIAAIETDFAELPPVECHASELNQVFLNLIVNAAHAIEEKNEGMGLIHISTLVPEAGCVEILITDNGCGIPEAIQHKIFDPFFTTKEVGKGTGQGLNLAFQVVESLHNGRILLDSTVGEGSRFRLKIPEKIQRDEHSSTFGQKYRQAIG
ncbi:MAG: PAS domain S-box protein [Pseudomonadales bacterium]|nr:PAS domain S-box protein [Pseudomonadales bacterium]